LKKTYLLPPLILAAVLTGCPSPTAAPVKTAASLSDYKIVPVGSRGLAASQPYGSLVSTPLPLK